MLLHCNAALPLVQLQSRDVIAEENNRVEDGASLQLTEISGQPPLSQSTRILTVHCHPDGLPPASCPSPDLRIHAHQCQIHTTDTLDRPWSSHRRSASRKRTGPSSRPISTRRQHIVCQSYLPYCRSSSSRRIQCASSLASRNSGQTLTASPTKWSLYRPLLRATYPARSAPVTDGTSAHAGLPSLRRHICAKWDKARQWTSITQTRNFLAGQYDLLGSLTSSSKRTILALRRRDQSLRRLYAHLDARQAARAAEPRPKPRLVGGYIYPTVYNPPIPRLKPQPLHISGMISRRIAARERRLHKMRLYQTYMEDMVAESGLEAGLGIRRESQGFEVGVREMIGEMQKSFEREKTREAMNFTERDVQRVERARRRKFAKTQAWLRAVGKSGREAGEENTTPGAEGSDPGKK